MNKISPEEINKLNEGLYVELNSKIIKNLSNILVYYGFGLSSASYFSNRESPAQRLLFFFMRPNNLKTAYPFSFSSMNSSENMHEKPVPISEYLEFLSILISTTQNKTIFLALGDDDKITSMEQVY